MKNITRRGFLQLTAATALVCATAPLTGCGKKNKKELIIGTWYRQGSDDLAFTIYDDGTCMIDNDMVDCERRPVYAYRILWE